MNYLKIGEMAMLNNVSIQTLRYYDDINLLKPVYVDPETRYRYYELSQSSHLDMILFLQSLDFSLDDINLLLSNPEKSEFINYAITKKQASLKKHEQEIKKKTKMITQFKQAYDCFVTYQNFNGVRIEYFQQRKIHTYTIDSNIYDMNLLDYEKHLRSFKLSLEKQGLGTQYFTQVGSIMKMEDFVNSNFISKELFLFDHDSDTEHLKVLEEGHYAVCYCHRFENELSTIKTLHRYLTNHNYEVIGDYICEVVYEFPYLSKEERNMFIRLQVPIKIKKSEY
ncbi:MerR family DNA-binding transcriptional regulator [Erysipelothrix urinaevulpis]|uniref:MerR family DNA-binding transcriptional regulator n=1 Tax=Erysipelothrix urinaevulpis TaxID=2683717 RepID=UPI00135A240C|nr:MerR family transcriptional regulator [Erysipelothrix urinaevulpis]